MKEKTKKWIMSFDASAMKSFNTEFCDKICTTIMKNAAEYTKLDWPPPVLGT